MPFTTHRNQDIVFHTADGFSAAGGVAHAFSTRVGGVSRGIWSSMNLGTTRGDVPDHVRENYRRFCAAVGTDAGAVVMSNQIHEANVRVVTQADRKADLYDPEGYETDGLVTDVPGLALTIFSADCIPVLLYDPRRRVTAAVHAGWRGTALGIADAAVEKMTGLYGCAPEDILAAIGPGIGPCCFETHGDVPDAMLEALGSAASPYLLPLPRKGKFSVDLKGLNALRLRRVGVTPGHIEVCGDCTCCHPELYWSHRRVGSDRGSQIAMLQLLPMRGEGS